MACTVAVETVIGEHYNDQIRELLQHGYREDELLEVWWVVAFVHPWEAWLTAELSGTEAPSGRGVGPPEHRLGT